MTMRIVEQDRQAIDLMLDHGTTGDGARTSGFVAPPSSDELRHRVAGIGRILSLLGETPAESPPPDLVARTLRRIDQRGFDLDGDAITVPPLFDADRPLA